MTKMHIFAIKKCYFWQPKTQFCLKSVSYYLMCLSTKKNADGHHFKSIYFRKNDWLMANSADPDKVSENSTLYLGLHCLNLFLGTSGLTINFTFLFTYITK